MRVGRNKSRPDTAVPAAPENEYAGDVLEDQESKGKGVESSVAFGGDGDGAHGVGVDVAGKDFHSHHGLSHGNEHGGLRHQFKREGSSSGARDVEIVDATDGEGMFPFIFCVFSTVGTYKVYCLCKPKLVVSFTTDCINLRIFGKRFP